MYNSCSTPRTCVRTNDTGSIYSPTVYRPTYSLNHSKRHHEADWKPSSRWPGFAQLPISPAESSVRHRNKYVLLDRHVRTVLFCMYRVMFWLSHMRCPCGEGYAAKPCGGSHEGGGGNHNTYLGLVSRADLFHCIILRNFCTSQFNFAQVCVIQQ